MTVERTSGMPGRAKAAALLISLGPDTSAAVLRHLDQRQIDAVTEEIVRMRRVPADTRSAVFAEVYRRLGERNGHVRGGLSFARDLLDRAVGAETASAMLGRLTGSNYEPPFQFVESVDHRQLVAWLEDEHPQTIALVLSHLSPETSGRLLSSLDEETQADVASRIAVMVPPYPEVTQQVETMLRRKLGVAGPGAFAGGERSMNLRKGWEIYGIAG